MFTYLFSEKKMMGFKKYKCWEKKGLLKKHLSNKINYI